MAFYVCPLKEEYMTQLVLQLISSYSLLYGVDPNLALAVAAHESKMNTNAVGALGELGLMQLRPEYFSKSCAVPNATPANAEHHGCGEELFRPEVNLEVGIRNLAYLQKTCVHKDAGTYIICHNLGIKGGAKIKHPRDFIYYKLVMIEYRKIEKQNLFAHNALVKHIAANP
jgi:hypothetical protein